MYSPSSEVHLAQGRAQPSVISLSIGPGTMTAKGATVNSVSDTALDWVQGNTTKSEDCSQHTQFAQGAMGDPGGESTQ